MAPDAPQVALTFELFIDCDTLACSNHRRCRYNPINHVSEWQTPTLVTHGALDHRVPLEQGIGLFTALQRRGIESNFLMFPDENHWILKPQNSVQWHHEVNNWLKAHLQ